MPQVISLYVTEDKHEKYENAIRYIQSQRELRSDEPKDREAIRTLLNLSLMIVTEYDRHEKDSVTKEKGDSMTYTVDFNKINEVADFAIKATGQHDSYSQGMCNGIEYLRATLTNTEPNFFDNNDSH